MQDSRKKLGLSPQGCHFERLKGEPEVCRKSITLSAGGNISSGEEEQDP
jgi:hypothetical protein